MNTSYDLGNANVQREHRGRNLAKEAKVVSYRKMGPILEDHPALSEVCSVCSCLFNIGDLYTVGDDRMLLHWRCK